MAKHRMAATSIWSAAPVISLKDATDPSCFERAARQIAASASQRDVAFLIVKCRRRGRDSGVIAEERRIARELAKALAKYA